MPSRPISSTADAGLSCLDVGTRAWPEVAAVGVTLPERHPAGDGDDEQPEHHLERQELAGQGARPRQAPV